MECADAVTKLTRSLLGFLMLVSWRNSQNSPFWNSLIKEKRYFKLELAFVFRNPNIYLCKAKVKRSVKQTKPQLLSHRETMKLLIWMTKSTIMWFLQPELFFVRAVLFIILTYNNRLFNHALHKQDRLLLAGCSWWAADVQQCSES